jgi:hypothetical protein
VVIEAISGLCCGRTIMGADEALWLIFGQRGEWREGCYQRAASYKICNQWIMGDEAGKIISPTMAPSNTQREVRYDNKLVV